MARKKELMELENPSMEGNTPVETADKRDVENAVKLLLAIAASADLP